MLRKWYLLVLYLHISYTKKHKPKQALSKFMSNFIVYFYTSKWVSVAHADVHLCVFKGKQVHHLRLNFKILFLDMGNTVIGFHENVKCFLEIKWWLLKICFWVVWDMIPYAYCSEMVALILIKRFIFVLSMR